VNARWHGEPRAELQVVANRSEQPRFVQEGREGVQQRPSSHAAKPQPKTFTENEPTCRPLAGFSWKPQGGWEGLRGVGGLRNLMFCCSIHERMVLAF
jgi:hypothetical protein